MSDKKTVENKKTTRIVVIYSGLIALVIALIIPVAGLFFLIPYFPVQGTTRPVPNTFYWFLGAMIALPLVLCTVTIVLGCTDIRRTGNHVTLWGIVPGVLAIVFSGLWLIIAGYFFIQ